MTSIAPFTISRVRKRRGAGLPMHTDSAAQLTYAAAGIAQVHTEAGRWLVPPQLAAWIPQGFAHRVELLSDAELWIVHFHPSSMKKWAPSKVLERAFALRVTPLLGSLLATSVNTEPGSRKVELAVRLMLHELNEMQDAPTFLPLPTSATGRRVADLALEDYRNQLGVIELASRAATSVRTISRIFPMETGLSFKAWRQRARIVWTMHRLAQGETIARVATDAGFATTAAFSAAFRQVTAMTPTAFTGSPHASL